MTAGRPALSVSSAWNGNKSVNSRWMIGAGVVVLVAASTIIALHDGGDDAANRSGSIRVVAGSATPPAATSYPDGSSPPVSSPSAVETRIMAMAGTPTSVLRDVKEVGGEHNACGKIAASPAASFRRFVWLDPVGLLATDDGSPDFARLMRICEGVPLQSLGKT